MQVNGQMEFTDVRNFMSARPFKGKYPAEKPQDMLMHLISASSYPGNTILDFFAGSGSTGCAALYWRRYAVLREGCRAICMEVKERWVKRAAKEMPQARLEQPYEPLGVH